MAAPAMTTAQGALPIVQQVKTIGAPAGETPHDSYLGERSQRVPQREARNKTKTDMRRRRGIRQTNHEDRKPKRDEGDEDQ